MAEANSWGGQCKRLARGAVGGRIPAWFAKWVDPLQCSQQGPSWRCTKGTFVPLFSHCTSRLNILPQQTKCSILKILGSNFVI
jgi:hypothetical protein